METASPPRGRIEIPDDPTAFRRPAHCTALTATPAMAGDATILNTVGPILATASSADQITAKCTTYLAEIERRKAELAGETGAATIEGTLHEIRCHCRPDQCRYG